MPRHGEHYSRANVMAEREPGRSAAFANISSALGRGVRRMVCPDYLAASRLIRADETIAARNKLAVSEVLMPSNRGVMYVGPGKVEVRPIPYPVFRNPQGKPIEHDIILKVVATNICGSDQHMVRGRTTAPSGMVLGHEITGEIIEKGRDVEYLEIGDLVSIPFNVACGRCRMCREQNTGVCLNVNPERPGGAYGYVDMGGWVGGQAEY